MVFFRAAESKAYEFLETPIPLHMIAVPALRRPNLTQNGDHLWLSPENSDLAKEKIRLMIKMASANGSDCLVLSAWGCGAYCNPPLCIASLFRSVFQEDLYRNAFRSVVFAIFDDQNARKAHNKEGNLLPFGHIFEVEISNSLESLV